MKKNILGAFVIIFVAVALFLMIDDIARSSKPRATQNVETYESIQQSEIATLDQED